MKGGRTNHYTTAEFTLAKKTYVPLPPYVAHPSVIMRCAGGRSLARVARLRPDVLTTGLPVRLLACSASLLAASSPRPVGSTPQLCALSVRLSGLACFDACATNAFRPSGQCEWAMPRCACLFQGKRQRHGAPVIVPTSSALAASPSAEVKKRREVCATGVQLTPLNRNPGRASHTTYCLSAL